MRRKYDPEGYTDYLKSQWWWDLKYKLITCNDNAKCFICHRKDTLLLHHISYNNLHHEKKWWDLFIICFNCHKKCHYFLFPFIKFPLKRVYLLFRLLDLKLSHKVYEILFIRKIRKK